MRSMTERTARAIRAWGRNPGPATKAELAECKDDPVLVGGEMKRLADLTPDDLRTWVKEERARILAGTANPGKN